MVDLAKIKPHGAVLVAAPPGCPPIGLKLSVTSMKTEAARKVQTRHDEEKKALIAAGKTEVPQAMRERHGIEVFAACVTGWEWTNDLSFGGKVPEFSYENVVKVLTDSPDWLLSSLVDYVRMESNFFVNFRKAS